EPANKKSGPQRIRSGPHKFPGAVSLESAGDAGQGASDRQTQGGQREDANDRDEGQKQTVLGQRLSVLALDARREPRQSLVDLGEHSSPPFQKIDRLVQDRLREVRWGWPYSRYSLCTR